MIKSSAPPLPTLSTAPPSYYNVANSQKQRWSRIKQVSDEYNISKHLSDKLQLLVPYKIILILDDSGTMMNLMEKSPLNDGECRVTRWEELTHFSEICINIANTFNQGGTDVYFLNRENSNKRMSADQLSEQLKCHPSGSSQITKTLNKVAKDLTERNGTLNRESKFLILLVTDGEPTDDCGSPDMSSFKFAVKNLPPNIQTSIVCFGNDKSKYIKKMSKLPRLHIHGDYYEEQSFSKTMGFGSFNYGDYVTKFMLACVEKEAAKRERKSFWSFLC